MSKICIYSMFVQVLFGSLAFAIDGHAQSRERLDEIIISLDLQKKQSLKKILSEIERETDFKFSYLDQEISEYTLQLNLNSKEESIKQVLTSIAGQTGLMFKRVNDVIYLKKNNNETELVIDSPAEIIKVNGKVLDETGEGLPGATIVAKGTSEGTITDIEGNFSLTVPEDAVLRISFVGYESQEVILAGQSNIEVTLDLDMQALEEVIVIGYGTAKREDVITAISSVKTEELMRVPSSDIGEMLRGKAPGVFVTVGNAGPGSSSSINIRGTRSLTSAGGNQPIVIADGVTIGSINDINPNDIESMEILKDASAQAIYGSRAANGVILITTKRGTSGKVRVDYNGYYGVQTVNRNFETYSAEEFADLRREAKRTENNGVYQPDSQIFTPVELAALESGEFIDWEKELVQIAPITNHNLSISSGSENTRFYSGVNYINQDGVIPGTDYEKVTIRLNADQKLADWLTLGVNTSWQVAQTNTPGTGGTLLRTVTASPLGKIYNEDGSLTLNPSGIQESFNPLLDIAETTSLKEDRNDIMNIFLDFTPIEGFKYRVNASRRSWNNKTSTYSTSESLAGYQRGGEGFGSLRFQEEVEWQLENILSYDFDINDRHTFNLVAVQSLIGTERRDFANTSSGLPNDLLDIYGLESAEINTPSLGNNFDRSLSSVVGRLQYSFNSKYYVTASVRVDGASVFGANNKWGSFPAFALGWNLHNEGFLSSVGMIDNLKLRAGYGSVGNQGISPYNSQSTAEQANYIIDGTKVTGYVPGDYLPNPDLKWETSTTTNIGLDFGLWTSRLSGTIELYDTRSTDLLVDRALPAGLGYTRTLTNLGEVQNRGVELSLNGVLVDKQDFTIDAGVTFSKNENKILSLYGTDADGDGVEDDDIGNLWFIGQPIDVYYRYQAVGIFQQGEDIVNNSHQPNAQPGDLKIFDADPTDGVLNGNDRIITKKAPDWFGTFNLNVNYKSIDFSASVYVVEGVIKDNTYLYGYTQGGSLRGVFNGVKQNYWTPENPEGNWPRPNAATDPANSFSLGLQDASYVRLQNVTLGFSLPEKVISKLRLSKMRLYVTGQNLFTLTEFQSYSPEKSPDEYPETIMLTGGIQVSF